MNTQESQPVYLETEEQATIKKTRAANKKAWSNYIKERGRNAPAYHLIWTLLRGKDPMKAFFPVHSGKNLKKLEGQEKPAWHALYKAQREAISEVKYRKTEEMPLIERHFDAHGTFTRRVLGYLVITEQEKIRVLEELKNIPKLMEEYDRGQIAA